MIRLVEIRKTFGGHEVLRGVSKTFGEGKVTCVIGPSGSGKSTLLRCINLLEKPTSGEIFIEGERAYYEVDRGAIRYHSESRITAVRRKLGMVFQDFALFPHLTAIENVTEGLVYGLGRGRQEAAAVATRVTGALGCGTAAYYQTNCREARSSGLRLPARSR